MDAREDLVATRDLIDHGGAQPFWSDHPHPSRQSKPRVRIRPRSKDPACLKMILNWEERRMSLDVPNLRDYDAKLREEANEPTLEVPQGEPTKKTQIIAIYGKGGNRQILYRWRNLSHMMAETGQARAA